MGDKGRNEDNSEYLFEIYVNGELNKLSDELKQLNEHRHLEYVVAINKLEEEYKDRLERIEIFNELKEERIQSDHERECASAAKECQDRQAELMDSLLQECEEQRRQIEHEFQTSDINNCTSSAYPINKKFLRRRPNERIPLNEKRVRTKTPLQIVYLLSEAEIYQDLQLCESPSTEAVSMGEIS